MSPRVKSSTSLLKLRHESSRKLNYHENRNSILADFIVLYEEMMNRYSELRNITKARSLPRDGQIRSNAACGRASDEKSIVSNKRKSQTFPLEKHQIHALGDRTSLLSANIPTNKDQNLASKWNKIRQGMSQCKKDIEEFKESLNQFKEEFYEGVSNIYCQLKEDEDRYTRLCYKINNVTDLHQTQLEYLNNLVKNMEEDNQRKQDECVLGILCEKLEMLDTKIERLHEE